MVQVHCGMSFPVTRGTEVDEVFQGEEGLCGDLSVRFDKIYSGFSQLHLRCVKGSGSLHLLYQQTFLG